MKLGATHKHELRFEFEKPSDGHNLHYLPKPDKANPGLHIQVFPSYYSFSEHRFVHGDEFDVLIKPKMHSHRPSSLFAISFCPHLSTQVEFIFV